MKQYMSEIAIEYDDQTGNILLSQPAGHWEEEDVIIIHPDQIPLLIKWLRAAREEAEKTQCHGET